MSRCEDYPCCGHTDGLGCNYSPGDYYWRKVASLDYDPYYDEWEY
jgi:hypothetical protein